MMDGDFFFEIMDALPNHYPGERIVLTMENKASYWKTLQRFEEKDFTVAIQAVMDNERRFPAPATIREYCERVQLERLQKERSEETLKRLREEEELLKKAHPKADSQHVPTREFVAAVVRGISSKHQGGGLIPELKKLLERYPKDKNLQDHIANIEREHVQAAVSSDSSPSIEGEKQEPPTVIEGPTCFKCKRPSESLLCDECRGHSVWIDAEQLRGKPGKGAK